MGIKFSNNASANIIKALTSTATSVSVTAGKGALFPSLTEGDYFYATLAGNTGLEIVKVTNRVNDTMTIVRAQDNTTALSFDTGDLFELRIVAADFNDTFSEVNDKLEVSIEEITSRVNSALSSKAPILHASSSTEYGAGSSEQYGHLKSHDVPDSTKTAATGHAFSPSGAAALQDELEDQISDLAGVVSGNAAVQATKDAAQDAAIGAAQSSADAAQSSADAAQSSADAKVATVNGLIPDENGNVDVGGMPLGTLMPYTGKDVPAGTLRADGTTYTGMRSSFPEFYEWVVNSGLTVALADYALVEGSCGYYGLDTSTGTVRMPALAAGVFGTVEAGKYGQAMQAGLPNITGEIGVYGANARVSGAVYLSSSEGDGFNPVGRYYNAFLDASRSSSVYGRSDTVTPSHVKYPWVIVVYNAAVPPSVAQAGEFIGLLDGKADKNHLDPGVAPGFVMPFAANTTPEGYLFCNGAAVSRTTYARLFDAIGTTYGEGDGSTTFHIPNLTDGRYIEGNLYCGVYREDGLPNITGSVPCAGASAWQGGNAALSTTGTGITPPYPNPYAGGTTAPQWLEFMASRSNTIYGASNVVQPRSLTMMYYIKY